MKNDLLYIDHVLETSDLIIKYTNGILLDDFMKNDMLYHAVVRNLQILAESTQKISPKMKEEYKDISWKELSGFRNILVHDYLEGIDPLIIWRTATFKLPGLRERFFVIKSELEKAGTSKNV